MTQVHFNMMVNNGHYRWMGAQSTLWERAMTMPVVPLRGERVELWPEGPLIEVKERWFDHEGTVFCDLRSCVIDPDSDEQRYQANAVVPTNWSWFTQSSGPLLGLLLDGGWKPHEQPDVPPGTTEP